MELQVYRTEEGSGANRAKLGPSQAFMQIDPSKDAQSTELEQKQKQNNLSKACLVLSIIIANGAADVPH
jgi:hypothetical protein